MITELITTTWINFDKILEKRWISDLGCFIPNTVAFLELTLEYPNECFAFLVKLKKEYSLKQYKISDKKIAKDLAICLFNTHILTKRMLTWDTMTSLMIWKPSEFTDMVDIWSNPVVEALWLDSNMYKPIRSASWLKLHVYPPSTWCLIRDKLIYNQEYILKIKPLVLHYEKKLYSKFHAHDRTNREEE